MNRRGRASLSLSPALFLCASMAALSVGCGEEEFVDDAYGAIDLAPYFFDGSSAANPTAGLPRDIIAKRGWVDGTRAEFYDFGLINFTRKRSSTGTTLAEPDVGYANPMYFFFNRRNQPLFSRPIFDKRTATFHMRGGKDALNVNPAGAPGGDNPRAKELEGRYYDLPYSARARNTVLDRARGKDDYQRPIIDRLQNDARYSGMWEIVEVTVNDDYVEDSIKSAKTLLAAQAAGKLSMRNTGKVINCPVLDDRTWVTPSNMGFQKHPNGRAFMQVSPRIEVWFRTKLGSCYLANGWETLGRTFYDCQTSSGVVAANEDGVCPDGKLGTVLRDPREDEVAVGNDWLPTLELWPAQAADWQRLDTFDVIRYDINNVKRVMVPIGKHYIPKVTVPTLNPTGGSSDVRYAHDDLQTAKPRVFDGDPGGYTPLVWLHDITVPQDPPFQGGTFKKLEDADPQRVAARTGVFVKNFPIAGISTPCRSADDSECGGTPFGLTCNRLPDLDLATIDVSPGGNNQFGISRNVADVAIEREGGPRCDVKRAGFGEYCAPGVARCDTHVADDAPEKKLLEQQPPHTKGWDPVKDKDKKLFSTGGPSFSFPMTNAPAAEYYRKWGYHKSITNRGYACHPSTGGYCYVRCDGGASGTGSGKDIYKKEGGASYGSSAEDVKALDLRMSRPLNERKSGGPWKFNYDNRCGGASMLGYLCASTRPNRQRVCLRECTTRNTDRENDEICAWDFNDKLSPPVENGPEFQGPVQLHSNFDPRVTTWKDSAGNMQTGDHPFRYRLSGQTCNTLQGATSCSWNPDFEPRGPYARQGQWPPADPIVP